MQAQATIAPQPPSFEPPLPPTPPTPPTPVVVAGGGGARIVIPGGTSAQAVYAAAKARGEELANQLERLEDRREELSQRLQQVGDEIDRKGLQQQLTDVDARIASVNQQIAVADQQIAQAAGIPGAIVEKPEPPPGRDGPPEVLFVVPVLFVLFVLFPLALAWSRRIWRRSSVGPATIPPELSQRIERIETAVESVAVEVERIREGQRFVNKQFAESPPRAQVEAPR
jgi:DNA repair exonuclease SbcCD ATPase subunit